MKRSSTEGSFAKAEEFAAAPNEGLAGSSFAAPKEALEDDLNGFVFAGAELAPGALNALLIGSVFVVAAGVAEGLGKVVAAVDCLKKPPDVSSEDLDKPPEGAVEGLATLFAGVFCGLATLFAGVLCGLANPPALGNPAEGAGFSFGSGALKAELMGCTGSALGAAGAAEG